MFFILSRFASWLTSPISWILILLFISLFISRIKTRKVLISVAALLAVIFSIPILQFETAAAWVPDHTMRLDSSRHYAYAFLPGGMTNFDSLTMRVEYGEAGDRIIEAASLFHLGIVDTLIISGDGGPNLGGDLFFSHLENVFDVSRTNVIVEYNARNTFQNFSLTQELVGANALNGNTLIVNSGQFMRRTILCAELSGWQADFYSVDYLAQHPLGWTVYVPTPATYEAWSKLIHEVVGYWAYSLAHGHISM